MNTLLRYFPAAALLGALLAFAGCDTARTAQAGPRRPDYQIAVVETSQGLELSPRQMLELRASAVNYLAESGLNRGGEYLVRIDLTPGVPAETDQWVVIRITSTPARTYTLLAAYPGSDDFYPYDYYGFYNYGYPGFSRNGYYDPFDRGFTRTNYYPPPVVLPPRDRKPDDRDHKPDDKGHQPGDRGNSPPGTPTRWDGNRPDPDRPRTDDDRTHRPHPRNDNGSRPHDNDGGAGGASPRPQQSSPAYSPPTYSPPSPPPARSEPPPRTESKQPNPDRDNSQVNER